MMRSLNRWFGLQVMNAAPSQNVEGESLGFVNVLFTYFYRLRMQTKKLKASHHKIYYIGRWVLIIGLIWLIFW